MTDRGTWPALMKPATARDYLDMGAAKFDAEVAPRVPRRQVGARIFFRKTDLDLYVAALDGGARSADRRDPSDWLEAVDHDLAASPRRQSRNG